MKRRVVVDLDTCATTSTSVGGVHEDRAQARETEPTAGAQHGAGYDAKPQGSHHARKSAKYSVNNAYGFTLSLSPDVEPRYRGSNYHTIKQFEPSL